MDTLQPTLCLRSWRIGTPDNTEIPPYHYDTLCHFDRQNETEYSYAMNYRNAEVPFVVYNIPEVDEVVKKWNNVDYLQRKLGYNSTGRS